jgi:putative membrane protein
MGWLVVQCTLYAHDAAAAPVAPSVWDALAMAAVAVGGIGYAVGSARLARRGASGRPGERIAFWIGWTMLAVAVAPPLDSAASVSFSAHMVQHELLMVTGAPLTVVGRPLVMWLHALPSRVRVSVGGGLSSKPLSRSWQFVTTPWVAWATHALVISLWHLPSWYEAALRSEPVHAVQHATFLATAVPFWWGLIYGRYGRASYGAAAFFVFLSSVHTGMLGAMFALGDRPAYALYVERARNIGLDAVADQQLGGLVMWVLTGTVLTIFGLGLVVAWLAEAERRENLQAHVTRPSTAPVHQEEHL